MASQNPDVHCQVLSSLLLMQGALLVSSAKEYCVVYENPFSLVVMPAGARVGKFGGLVRRPWPQARYPPREDGWLGEPVPGSQLSGTPTHCDLRVRVRFVWGPGFMLPTPHSRPRVGYRRIHRLGYDLRAVSVACETLHGGRSGLRDDKHGFFRCRPLQPFTIHDSLHKSLANQSTAVHSVSCRLQRHALLRGLSQH
jgi:hypothetical protein